MARKYFTWSTQDRKEEGEEGEMTSISEKMNEEDKNAASKLISFEDMMEVVGSSGRWNVYLFLLCSFSSMLSSFITMSYQFLGATPDHWCSVASLKEANWTNHQIFDLAIPFDNKTGQYERCHMYDYNYTKAAQLGYDVAVIHPDDLTDKDTPQVIPCSVRDFNLTQHESSVVTEWDLVCERRVLYSTTQAANQVGFLIGATLTPFFTDRFGRRPVALCAMTLALLQGLASCFSSSVKIFIALRAGLSGAALSLVVCSFLILMELCTPSTRSSFGTLFSLAWAVGSMVLSGIAYLIRPWRYLQAAIAVPYLIFILASRFLPESPRWLLLQDRYEDVENILARIAATNCRKIPSRIVLRAALERISQQMRVEERLGQDKQSGKNQHNIRKMALAAVKYTLSPYRTVQLAFRMCLLIVMWILVACAYYGISLNATNISADPYLYIFLGGVSEVFAALILWLLVTYAGRRPSLCGLYIVCALCIAVNATLMFAFPTVSVTAKIVLSLLGKMAIAAAFHLVYLYTNELFTTKQRSLAICHCCFFGRIGSVSSPYINDILGETAVWAPSAVFSMMTFVSSLLSLLLPETRNKNLPEDDHSLTNAKVKRDQSEMYISSNPSA